MNTKVADTKAKTEPAKRASKFAGKGVDALFGGASANPNEYTTMVNLDDIEINNQVRDQDKMEDEEDAESLANLGKSLRVRQLQEIGLRLNVPGAMKPYRLIWGERRVKGARIEGLSELRARIMDLNDEEAKEAQFFENIHRKNLTQIEEAKELQRELDIANGDIDVVCAKYKKGRPWVSKRLSLLSLPDETKRLITEGITADVEVISTVKQVEKASPEKAKALVNDLKASRGKENARDKANAVKEQVKPSKKPKTPPPPPKSSGSGVMATPKDRSAEAPGAVVENFADAKSKTVAAHSQDDAETGLNEDADPFAAEASAPALPPSEPLNKAYTAIFEQGRSAKSVLEGMAEDEKDDCESWLYTFYKTGMTATDIGRTVIQGMRTGQFATDGYGAFALVAFLYGSDSDAKRFSLLDIFGSVKS